MNVVWSGVDYAVMPVGMLIATPILINYMGLEQYGLLVLINALIGFSAVFNFGFGDTALKYVSHYLNLGERERASEIVRTVSGMATVSGVVVAGLFIVAVPVLSQVFRVQSIPMAMEALYIAGLILPLRLFESVLIATLRGCYRYDLSTVTTALSKIVIAAAYIVLSALGFNLTALLWATVLALLGSIASLFVLSRQQLANVYPQLTVSAFREIVRFSSWSWVQSVAGLVYANIDRLVVSALLGPTALGIYGVCIQLAQSVHNGLSATSHSYFPRISMLNAESAGQSEDKNRIVGELYIQVSRTLSIASALAASVLVVFGYEILDLWVGQQIANDGGLVLSMLGIAFGWYTANHAVTYYTLNGMGRAGVQAFISAVAACLLTISCLLLVPVLGLLGGAVARFSDIPFRIAMRMYVGSSVLQRGSKLLVLDFPRMVGFAIGGLYLLKQALEMWVGADSILTTPLSLVALLLFVLGMYFGLHEVERRLTSTRLERH